jgi:alpha-tubulin suppressor-like RCC1 family protein
MEGVADATVGCSRSMKKLSITLSIAAALLLLGAASAAAHSAYFFGSFYGEGPAYQQSTPAATNLQEVVAVQASNSSDYALLANGQVWAWGGGESGQLGNGQYSNSPTPVRVLIPEGVKIVSIGQARDEGVAISSTGAVYGWGEDSLGSLCTRRTYLGVPIEISSLRNDGVIAESGGGAHTLWLTSSGHVLACGNKNSSGLGPNAQAPGATPTMIPGLANIVQVSGSGASAALTSSGQVYAWGADEHGQVGIGWISEYVPSPMQVSLPEPALQIATGGDNGSNGSSAALTRSGALYSWGDNENGQLGNGISENESLPVATGLTYAQIAVGATFMLGLTESGELQSFGSSAHGVLGDGMRGPAVMAPVTVATGVTGMASVARESMIER